MQRLQTYFELTERQVQQFESLPALYKEWNDKINVISRKDINNLEVHHLLHSLAIAKVQAFKPGMKILDVGTGGGFPGLPLAILFPEAEFLLVDSIGKKIKVVNEIASATGLRNLKAVHARAEDVEGSFDFVVSRAVTRLTVFWPWVKNKISKSNKGTLANGILYLKGGDLSEEVREAALRTTSYPISSFFKEDFFETKVVLHITK